MTRTLHISRLRQRAVRNLQPAEIEFCPRFNLIWGNNGQGKTSLLEAIVLAATGRSFRTDLARDLIQHGSPSAAVDVDVMEGEFLRTQRVEIAEGRKSTSVDGKRVARAADFAVATPVVVFHPADLELISGPASLRRTLLTRIALYLQPYSFDSHRAYLRAMSARQRLLFDNGIQAAGLDAFEQLASEHGAVVTAAFEQSARELVQSFSPTLEQLAPQLRVTINHHANGTADRTEFAAHLKDSRRRDLARGRPLFGPQRDDLQVALDGADARRHASQGQQRLLALVLKLAELATIRSARAVHPILLLDDVTSELDPNRTHSLLEWLGQSPSQVFVTTTQVDASLSRVDLRSGQRVFLVRGGVAEQEIRASDTGATH